MIKELEPIERLYCYTKLMKLVRNQDNFIEIYLEKMLIKEFNIRLSICNKYSIKILAISEFHDIFPELHLILKPYNYIKSVPIYNSKLYRYNIYIWRLEAIQIMIDKVETLI